MKIMSSFGEFDRRPAAYHCRCVVIDWRDSMQIGR